MLDMELNNEQTRKIFLFQISNMAGSMMIERPGSIGLGDKMDPVQYLAM